MWFRGVCGVRGVGVVSRVFLEWFGVGCGVKRFLVWQVIRVVGLAGGSD